MTSRNLSPATRDRLAGRYCGQCPSCRTGRNFGPDCAGAGPDTPRRRRKAERAALRRYVTAELGTEPADPLVDPSDCQHGCNGDCVTSEHGSERCDFTCHPDTTRGPAS